MQIHLLQHMLASYFGHWFNETLGWIAASRAAGVGLQVYAAREVNAAVVQQTGARGVYALTNDIVERYGLPGRYARTPDPHCQDLINFMAWSETFRRACQAIGSENIGGDDLLAVPFATINEVHGAALWLENIPAERRPAVLFNFHEPHYAWHVGRDRDRARADFSLSRYAARRLQGLLPARRIIVTAADRRLCTLLQQAFGLPCHLTPMLMNYAQEASGSTAASPVANRPLKVSVMGDFRREKGSERVLDAFLAFAGHRPDTRFFVQVRTAADADGLRNNLQRAAPGLCLEMQVGTLPQEQYLERLRQSDLVLLPYAWERYAIRTSGVFAEAAACGVPVVVPDHTWMADQLDAGHGAGETFAEWTPAAIAAAMNRAAQRIGELQARAQAGSATWRQVQSMTAYLDNILHLWRGRDQDQAAVAALS